MADQQCPRKLVHHISKTMNKNVNSVSRKGDWCMESGVILSGKKKKKEKPDYSCPKWLLWYHVFVPCDSMIWSYLRDPTACFCSRSESSESNKENETRQNSLGNFCDLTMNKRTKTMASDMKFVVKMVHYVFTTSFNIWIHTRKRQNHT